MQQASISHKNKETLHRYLFTEDELSILYQNKPALKKIFQLHAIHNKGSISLLELFKLLKNLHLYPELVGFNNVILIITLVRKDVKNSIKNLQSLLNKASQIHLNFNHFLQSLQLMAREGFPNAPTLRLQLQLLLRHIRNFAHSYYQVSISNEPPDRREEDLENEKAYLSGIHTLELKPKKDIEAGGYGYKRNPDGVYNSISSLNSSIEMNPRELAYIANSATVQGKEKKQFRKISQIYNKNSVQSNKIAKMASIYSSPSVPFQSHKSLILEGNHIHSFNEFNTIDVLHTQMQEPAKLNEVNELKGSAPVFPLPPVLHGTIAMSNKFLNKKPIFSRYGAFNKNSDTENTRSQSEVSISHPIHSSLSNDSSNDYFDHNISNVPNLSVNDSYNLFKLRELTHKKNNKGNSSILDPLATRSHSHSHGSTSALDTPICQIKRLGDYGHSSGLMSKVGSANPLEDPNNIIDYFADVKKNKKNMAKLIIQGVPGIKSRKVLRKYGQVNSTMETQTSAIGKPRSQLNQKANSSCVTGDNSPLHSDRDVRSTSIDCPPRNTKNYHKPGNKKHGDSAMHYKSLDEETINTSKGRKRKIIPLLNCKTPTIPTSPSQEPCSLTNAKIIKSLNTSTVSFEEDSTTNRQSNRMIQSYDKVNAIRIKQFFVGNERNENSKESSDEKISMIDKLRLIRPIDIKVKKRNAHSELRERPFTEKEKNGKQFLQHKLKQMRFVFKKFCAKQGDIWNKWRNNDSKRIVNNELSQNQGFSQQNKNITIVANNPNKSSISIINTHQNYLNCSIKNPSLESSLKIEPLRNKLEEKDNKINLLEKDVKRLKTENYKLLNEVLNLKIQLKKAQSNSKKV